MVAIGAAYLVESPRPKTSNLWPDFKLDLIMGMDALEPHARAKSVSASRSRGRARACGNMILLGRPMTAIDWWNEMIVRRGRGLQGALDQATQGSGLSTGH